MTRIIYKNIGVSILLVSTFLVLFRLPAANAAFVSSLSGSTLTLTQVVNDGAVTIDNNGAGNEFRVIDGSGTTAYVTVSNVIVNMINGTENQLNIDFDNPINGFATFNAGDGPRVIKFIGTSNSFSGDLKIICDRGVQTVELSAGKTLVVGGSLLVDLGFNDDIVDEDNRGINVTGKVELKGVNRFIVSGTLTVGGDFTMVDSVEAINSTLQIKGKEQSTIGGNFNYRGGSDVDNVFLHAVKINGNVDIDLSNGFTTGDDDQNVEFSGRGSVGGELRIESGDSTNGDNISFLPGTTFGGNLIVNLREGNNYVKFMSTYNGNRGKYRGGSGVDNIHLNASAESMRFDIRLRDGDDSLTLNAGTLVASLFVDFGCFGMDTFIDNLGTPYPFPATIRNLDMEECVTGNTCFVIQSIKNPTG